MAKRKGTRKSKPRKTAKRRPVQFKASKPMARKAPKRRKASRPAKVTRRRSSGRRSRGLMDLVMPVLMASGGYLAAEYLLPKVLKTSTPMMRGGIAAGAGIGLAMLSPSLAPLALGVGVQGMVGIGRDVLKLPAPVNGIRGLSDSDRRALARMADIGMVNGRDSKFINGPRPSRPAAMGGQAADMLNGVQYMGGDDTDRAYRSN